MMPGETGKNNMRYRGALAVLAALALAAGLGCVFRRTGLDERAIGLERLAHGDLDGAIIHLGRSLRENPADPAARLALAQSYQRKGWIDEAIKQYEQAIELGQKDGPAFFSAGLAAERSGHRAEACVYYEAA